MSDQETSEVIVVVSKLKSYVKSKGGMNTSDKVAAIVSDRVRQILDEAVEKAKADGRKTLMDRDFS